MSDATQNYVRIPLTQGKFAIIDVEDFPEIGKYKWHLNSNRAARNLPRIGPKPWRMYMHHQILALNGHQTVDHIDGNPLNNTKANLRLASYTENQRNVGLMKTNSSGFKGVSKMAKSNKWRARLDTKFLGAFDTPEEAFEAYRSEAMKIHGEFYFEKRPTRNQEWEELLPIAKAANRINHSCKSNQRGA